MPAQGDHTKYAPKYASWRSVLRVLSIPKTTWKCAFNTSRSYIENTRQRPPPSGAQKLHAHAVGKAPCYG